MMRCTHMFDFVYQMILGLASLMVGGTVWVAIAPVFRWVETAGTLAGLPEGVSGVVAGVIAGAGLLASCIGAGLLLGRTILPPALSSYLYVRLWLFTPITWRQAQYVTFLFEGGLGERWYPLTELRKVPRQYRTQVLLEFADRVLTGGVTGATREAPSPPPSPPQADPGRARYERSCAVLGLAPGASFGDVKAAYRNLMRRFHPDIFARLRPQLRWFAEEKAKEINEAYAYLEQWHGAG